MRFKVHHGFLWLGLLAILGANRTHAGACFCFCSGTRKGVGAAGGLLQAADSAGASLGKGVTV